MVAVPDLPFSSVVLRRILEDTDPSKDSLDDTNPSKDSLEDTNPSKGSLEIWTS